MLPVDIGILILFIGHTKLEEVSIASTINQPKAKRRFLSIPLITNFKLKKTEGGWDKIVLNHKKARDFQLWNSSFLISSRSLIVF